MIITLFLAEGIIRTSGIVDMQLNCKFTEHELFKDYSYFEKQSLCNEYSSIGYDRNDVIQIPLPKEGKHLNINSDGFRGKEMDLQNKDYTIFFLGGSTAFGVVSSGDEFTIPAILEKKLASEGFEVSVINAGVPNSNSRDERYYIEKYISKYSPNMIIMYDGWNDMVPLKDNFTYEQFKNQSYYVNQMVPDENITKTGILTLFAKIDYKTGIGIAKYFSNILYSKNIERIDEFSEKHLVTVETRLQDNWSNVCEFGNKNNIIIVNILQPILGSSNRTLSEFEKFSSIEFYNPYLWKFHLDNRQYHPCNQVHDLRNVFEGMDEIPIYFDNGHTSDFGNEIIANQISEKIIPIILQDIKSKTNQ